MAVKFWKYWRWAIPLCGVVGMSFLECGPSKEEIYGSEVKERRVQVGKLPKDEVHHFLCVVLIGLTVRYMVRFRQTIGVWRVAMCVWSAYKWSREPDERRFVRCLKFRFILLPGWRLSRYFLAIVIIKIYNQSVMIYHIQQ
jgi:hypothetical protein